MNESIDNEPITITVVYTLIVLVITILYIRYYRILCDLMLYHSYLFSESGEYTVKTIAGNGDEGHVDGEGSQAQFNNPCGVTIDNNNNIIVTDTENHRIRMIEFNR